MIFIFGYAVPEKSELKFREYEFFKMYYCGVCCSIGRRYGQSKRFGLVNEMGMLALLLDCITGQSDAVPFRVRRCAAHPFRKSPMVIGSAYTDYAADVNVLFAYFKLQDSWLDDRNLLAGIGSAAAFRRAAGKVRRRHPALFRSMESRLASLHEAEKARCASLDQASEHFSSLMADIFTEAPDIRERIKTPSDYDTEQKLVSLRDLGYYIGKWIYLIDALCDIEEDLKKHHYNPILLRFQYASDETVAQFKERIKEDLQFVFYDALGKCAEAWKILSEDQPDLPGARNAKGFIENVLFLGMRAKTQKGFITDEPI